MKVAETTIIGRLKLVRQELGLTQREFASGAGISYGLFINLESGIRNITDKTIHKICDAYSVNEKWLRLGEGRMFSTEGIDDATDRRDAFNFFARVFNLTPDKQLQLAEFAGYDIDVAELYAQSDDAAKRNVARLIKAIDNGSGGRVDQAVGV